MAGEESEEFPKRREPAPPVEFLRPGEAQAPMPPRDQPPAAWVPRPEEFGLGEQERAWPGAPPADARRSNLPAYAGVFLLLAAFFGMASTVVNVLDLPTVEEYRDFVTNNSYELIATSQICALISIWSQALALLGGIMAFQRMNWRLALLCSIFAIAALGFFFEASVFGVIGLLLLLRARPHFMT